MASEDDFHSKNPETNAWMEEAKSSALGKLSAISSPGKQSATARTVLSAHLQRLARAVGLNVDELVERIPADTIRRTKFPVRERKMSDGTTLFEDDEGIVEGPRPLLKR